MTREPVDDRPTVDIRSQLASPYEHNLRLYEYGRIPARFDYAVTASNLVARQTEYHAQFPTVPRQPNTWKANHTFIVGR